MRNIVLATVLLLGGCAVTMGAPVNPAALASLQIGKTTLAQAEQALGVPTKEVRTADFVRLVYTYTRFGFRDMEESDVTLTFTLSGFLSGVETSKGHLPGGFASNT